MNDPREHPQDAATPEIPDAALRSLTAGQLIAGRFRLDRLLGKGGAGVVWAARDESLRDKPRALKFLTETFAQDAMAVAELKEEVARCQELSHPHIIRVHDLVEDREHGLVAVSMEIATGGTLNARRAQRPHRWFEPEELRAWLCQLCAVLDYAHTEARLIHRDLKPANLLLDERDRLKVADFGIAHAVSESVTRLNGGLGPTSGTPAYMSPQQASGKKPRASDDIYGLGATLYDLLTGKPPYLGSHPGIVLHQVRDLDLRPPSIAERRLELRNVEAPIPAEWEEVIADCLSKNPEERPRTAGEVLVRLGFTTATPRAVERGPLRVEPRPAPPAAPQPPERLAAEAPTVRAPVEPAPRGWWLARSLVILGLLAVILLSFGARSFLERHWASQESGQRTSPTPPPESPAKVPAAIVEAAPPASPPESLPASPIPVAPVVAATPAPAEPPPAKIEPMPAVVVSTPEPSEPVPTAIEGVRLLIGSKVIKKRDEIVFGPPFGFIDTLGKTVIPPQWEDAGVFTEGLARIKQGGKHGFINTGGDIVIPPQWDDAFPFDARLARVRKGGKWGFIDPDGKALIPLAWDHAGPFSHGLARVSKGGRWGFIDADGKVVIQPAWDSAFDFADGMAVVKQGGKSGFIDPAGKVLIKPKWTAVYDFAEGLALVKQSGQYGFIDKTGSPIGQPQWADAFHFAGGLAHVKQGRKFGYIDTSSKLVIPPQWGGASFFAEGLARVEQGGKWGFIDKTGNYVIPPEWEQAGDFAEGYAPVRKAGKWGIIDAVGKVVVPLEWDATGSPTVVENGDTYLQLIKKTAPGKALTVWLDPALTEIRRAEVPFEEARK